MREEVKLYLSAEDIAYYTSLGINLDSDLLDPKVDGVFKAMFTSDTEESRQALKHFLSNVLKRKITIVDIKNNELPTTGLLEKQSTFDIHVSFDEGDEAEIEMQMYIKDDLVSRSEYNTAKLYSSQGIKGKLYANLKKVYSIMVLNHTLFKDREDFFDEYMYRNSEGKPLSGNTRIIFIELSKIDKVMKKPVSEMTAIEKWSIFLRYANHLEKQALIHEIVKSEEGIKMGAQVLETISNDRAEYIAYYQKLKAEVDRESQMLYAEEKGKLGVTVNMIRELQLSISKAMEISKLDKSFKKNLIEELKEQNIEYVD